jgi:RND family efflux transporter MFP subunit
LRLRLEVPERESLLVCLGQTVRLRVEGSTNLFTGKIARLSPALDEASRMLLVEADVPNPGALRAGLFARAQIVVQEREEGLTVPASAVVTFAGIEKVFTVEEGRALEKPVTTGRRGLDWVEITSGLETGAPVVLDPGGLRGGQPVRPAAATSPGQQTNSEWKLSSGL